MRSDHPTSQHDFTASAETTCLFSECLDHFRGDMQEEDGCDEGDSEHDDNVGITVTEERVSQCHFTLRSAKC